MSKAGVKPSSGAPKRPLNAYFRFMQEYKDTAAKDGDFRKNMKKMWDQFDPATKAEYEKEYKEQMEKYKEDIAIW